MRPIVAVAVLGIVAVQLRQSLDELAFALMLIAPAILLLRGIWRTAGNLKHMGRRHRL